jgi:hypothetical protein
MSAGLPSARGVRRADRSPGAIGYRLRGRNRSLLTKDRPEAGRGAARRRRVLDTPRAEGSRLTMGLRRGVRRGRLLQFA